MKPISSTFYSLIRVETLDSGYDRRSLCKVRTSCFLIKNIRNRDENRKWFPTFTVRNCNRPKLSYSISGDKKQKKQKTLFFFMRDLSISVTNSKTS